MKNRHACTVIKEKPKSIIIQFPSGKQVEVVKDLLAFEALKGDELWVSLNNAGEITLVEQKDFSRGYGTSEDVGDGKIEMYVSPAREPK